MGGRVVLVAGCEISLWCAGFLPGGDSVSGRIATVTDPDLRGKPDVMAALASGLERASHTLRDIVRAARERFAGPVTYAAAPWETVDWDLFDLVSVDAYRDADNAARYRDELRAGVSASRWRSPSSAAAPTAAPLAAAAWAG